MHGIQLALGSYCCSEETRCTNGLSECNDSKMAQVGHINLVQSHGTLGHWGVD